MTHPNGHSLTLPTLLICANLTGVKSDVKNDILLSHSFRVGDIKVVQDYQRQDLADTHTRDFTETSVKYIDFNQEDECATTSCKSHT